MSPLDAINHLLQRVGDKVTAEWILQVVVESLLSDPTRLTRLALDLGRRQYADRYLATDRAALNHAMGLDSTTPPPPVSTRPCCGDIPETP